MTVNEYSFSARNPSVDDFGASFPQYKPFAMGEGKKIFDLLMKPESLISAIEATKLGLPAVTGIAEIAVSEIERMGKKPTGFDKQFIGGVICSLMEANGYRKTGTKRAISHEAFSKGEFYEPLEN